ncbi:DegV [Syntrophomonas zehnderi OL-4]|uniref:DegV n=1 Tax=Syntrophomonas zehnderi OL-4 TaxID=690567 RepID=A0A0E4C805_9FIRM|nr:DegV family protein [Syntrophomonas zehnderi]CFX20531.1 DegV [Syntrophomonas zehnderi OL-4]
MIKIIADSTCDLPLDVIEKYDIGMALATIIIDGHTYRDKIDMTANDFFNIIEDLPEPPITSMSSPNEYLNIFNQAVLDGHNQILCICMSSGTSGAYQSAVIAQSYFYEEHPQANVQIHIVDSKCMSHGSGWLTLKSARLKEQGSTFEQLIEFNERYKTRVKHFLSVDDLEHLRRSGRLSNASTFIGKILNIRPIMTMKNSRGAIVAKEKGRKRVLEHYVREFIKRHDPEITDFIIIGYSSDLTYAENLKHKLIRESNFAGEVFIMQMGIAVGTHVGLGGLSMFFVEKDLKTDSFIMNELNELREKKNELLDKIHLK